MVSELDRTSLLRYENVSISFGVGRREKFALRDFNLSIGVGERVALVGESGSGKTLSALAPLQLEPEGAKVSGKIWCMRCWLDAMPARSESIKFAN